VNLDFKVTELYTVYIMRLSLLVKITGLLKLGGLLNLHLNIVKSSNGVEL